MQSKTSDDRRRQILERARSAGSVTVVAIADGLNVSAETVRRDFKVLEDHGLLRRTHGGAYPVDGAGFETSVSRSSEYLLGEKRRIAVAAIDLLGDADTLYVDEGFTPGLVAQELMQQQTSLTVVTPSLAVASILAPIKSISVILLGGRVRGASLATVDHWAINMLSDLVIDLAVLGTNGITRDRGLTTPSPAVSAVKHKAVEVSRRRVLVGVHTKFGINSFCRFANVADFETLVTDVGLPVRDAHRFTALGPAVVRV